MKIDFHDAVQGILAEHREYKAEAYQFLYTVATPGAASHNEVDHPTAHHMTASEFYSAVCRYAMQEYGPMAHTVFDFWGLHTTRDVAAATYHLIAAGILTKQRHESIDDFDSLPTLELMLDAPFQPSSSRS